MKKVALVILLSMNSFSAFASCPVAIKFNGAPLQDGRSKVAKVLASKNYNLVSNPAQAIYGVEIGQNMTGTRVDAFGNRDDVFNGYNFEIYEQGKSITAGDAGLNESLWDKVASALPSNCRSD